VKDLIGFVQNSGQVLFTVTQKLKILKLVLISFKKFIWPDLFVCIQFQITEVVLNNSLKKLSYLVLYCGHKKAH